MLRHCYLNLIRSLYPFSGLRSFSWREVGKSETWRAIACNGARQRWRSLYAAHVRAGDLRSAGTEKCDDLSSNGTGGSNTLAGGDVNGFVPIPTHPDGQDHNIVYVIAAKNCPHADSQRADRLTADLAAKHIPVIRGDTVGFTFHDPAVEGATQQELVLLNSGKLPIVFLRGRVKNNPTLAEVIAEYWGAAN